MEYINQRLTEDLAKKILGNKETAILYLKELNIKEVSQIKKSTKADFVWSLVVKYWNYKVSKNIIRNLFKKTKKYQEGKIAIDSISILIKE